MRFIDAVSFRLCFVKWLAVPIGGVLRRGHVKCALFVFVDCGTTWANQAKCGEDDLSVCPNGWLHIGARFLLVPVQRFFYAVCRWRGLCGEQNLPPTLVVSVVGFVSPR